VFRKQFTDLKNACVFAEAIVATVREPLLVLDQDLRIVAASRSFCLTFKVNPDVTKGKLLYELGDGEWNIPKLRLLLEKIIPEHGVMEGYEVEHEFPGLGCRTMCLNARQVFYEVGSRTNVLLGIEDITERLSTEHEKDNLLRQKEILLREIQHRIGNSLQIIASVIMMKSRSVDSEEMRRHLEDTHQRVMSVATIQKHLYGTTSDGESIEVKPYLTTLCEAIALSMIDNSQHISIKVSGNEGNAICRDAESLGLIVTELVINSLKHAFNEDTENGQITVAYDVSGTDWKLSVADNGIGKPDGVLAQPKAGLGTGIVKALAQQLDAKVETLSGSQGTTVSIIHATFAAKEIRAAARQSA
jgi:two-component sensor histidine kinase